MISSDDFGKKFDMHEHDAELQRLLGDVVKYVMPLYRVSNLSKPLVSMA